MNPDRKTCPRPDSWLIWGFVARRPWKRTQGRSWRGHREFRGSACEPSVASWAQTSENLFLRSRTPRTRGQTVASTR